MAKILIVDDSAFMRGSLKFIMEEDGHLVVGMAGNGKEALDRYRQLRPDIVTLDIVMQEMDGLTALKAIRQEDPKAAIIMVTSLNQNEVTKQAKDLGVAGFITKPFNPQDIKAEVKRVLGK